jgi:magnesium transporter
MIPKDLTRPDKLLFKGIKTLTGIPRSMYTEQKTKAKAKAELAFIGEKKVEKVDTQLYIFTPGNYTLEENLLGFPAFQTVQSDHNAWLNFHGLHEVPLVEKIGDMLQLDRLMIRQILDTTQRPKVEIDEQHLFLNIKAILNDEHGALLVEHMSFVMGPNYLVSFQEEKGDHFESIRHKITEGVGFIRKRSIDYLLVQLLDTILDNFFSAIDTLNEECALLEKAILRNPDEETTLALENLKRSAQSIKKALGPFREVLLNILNEDSGLIRKENIRYFKDLINTTTSAIDEIDNTQKTLESLTNIYFASLSQKMNEIMKVLTTVATIFIPLTFVAGIYGMNFDYMPELSMRYGYFFVLGIMLLVSVVMVIYFKRDLTF